MTDVIAQKHRRIVQARERDIDTAIVIVVADGQTASQKAPAENGASQLFHVAKHAMAVVSQKQRRLPIQHIHPRLLDHWIDVAVSQHQVQISIVIVIDEVRAPADVEACERRQSGFARCLVEGKFAEV